VYVLRSDTFGGGMTKIGISACAHCRCRNLALLDRRLNDLHVVKTWERDDARQIELRTHRMLAEHRANGEWFRCSAADACAAVDRVILEAK
jgi:hypothetical protein